MQRTLLTFGRRIPTPLNHLNSLNKNKSYKQITQQNSFLWRINTNPAAGARFETSRHHNVLGEKEKEELHKKFLKELKEKMSKPNKFQTSQSQKADRAPPPPPLPLHFSGLVGKLSHELFETSNKNNELEIVQSNLPDLLNVVKENSDTFYTLLISREKKLALIKEKMPNISSSLLQVVEKMVNENRIDSANILSDYFNQLFNEKFGIVPATVTSVEPLTSSQLRRIEEKILSILPPGKKLNVSTALNPKLIGGFKVRFGDLEMDLSLASKVKEFEAVFNTALK